MSTIVIIITHWYNDVKLFIKYTGLGGLRYDYQCLMSCLQATDKLWPRCIFFFCVFRQTHDRITIRQVNLIED